MLFERLFQSFSINSRKSFISLTSKRIPTNSYNRSTVFYATVFNIFSLHVNVFGNFKYVWSILNDDENYDKIIQLIWRKKMRIFTHFDEYILRCSIKYSTDPYHNVNIYWIRITNEKRPENLYRIISIWQTICGNISYT